MPRHGLRYDLLQCPRAIDTSRHFCPHPGCDDRGWLGLGNLHANGHPNGGQWRQSAPHVDS